MNDEQAASSEDESEKAIQNLKGDLIKQAQTVRFWFELVAFGVAVWVAFIYTGQWGEMRKATQQSTRAADAAGEAAQVGRDTLVASQRPWVGLTYPVIPVFSPQGLSGLDLPFQNYGTSPALKVFAAAVPTQSYPDIPVQQDHICDGFSRYSAEPTPHGTVLFPSGRGGQHITAAGGENRTVFSQSLPMWFAGCIVYWDQFSRKHTTRFCLETKGVALRDFTPGTALGTCGSYNSAD